MVHGKIGGSMSLPEDRHPLLCMHVNVDNDRPDKERSRCISQGATALLEKWPDHLTFSWMMGVIGVVSLLTCFLLTVILLVMASSGYHNGRRPLIEKCEQNDHVVQFVHMKNLEDLRVTENATYFVEIYRNESKMYDTLCSVESFLKHYSTPVFLVIIFPGEPTETPSKVLEKTYNNFKTINYDLNSFFDRTLFANVPKNDTEYLEFLARVLVSWNVGGNVLDSAVKSIGNNSELSRGGENKEVMLLPYQDKVFLISTKRFCHAFIFDVLKTVLRSKNTENHNQAEIIKEAIKRFCRSNSSCKEIHLLPENNVCTPKEKSDNCTFLIERLDKWRTLCDGLTECLCPNIWRYSEAVT